MEGQSHERDRRPGTGLPGFMIFAGAASHPSSWYCPLPRRGPMPPRVYRRRHGPNRPPYTIMSTSGTTSSPARILTPVSMSPSLVTCSILVHLPVGQLPVSMPTPAARSGHSSPTGPYVSHHTLPTAGSLSAATTVTFTASTPPMARLSGANGPAQPTKWSGEMNI